MYVELFVGLSYKPTLVSFVLNPKAPKSSPFKWITSTENGFSASQCYLKSCCYLLQQMIIRPPLMLY